MLKGYQREMATLSIVSPGPFRMQSDQRMPSALCARRDWSPRAAPKSLGTGQAELTT